MWQDFDAHALGLALHYAKNSQVSGVHFVLALMALNRLSNLSLEVMIILTHIEAPHAVSITFNITI